MARAFKTGISADGDIATGGVLKSTASAGDEGGQIDLTKAATNTTLTTGVSIDVYQNKLRIFETGGTNRGFYLDVSGASAGVGTNLSGTAAVNFDVAGKNALINGGFDIWQRGGSGSFTTAAYTADRWYGVASGSGAAWSQSSTAPTGSRYSIQVVPVSGSNTSSINQNIETANTLKYAGQNVVITVKIYAASSLGMTLSLGYSTTVDAASSATFTNITATSGGTATASASWTTITGVFAVPSNANTLKVTVGPTSATGVQWYVSQAQLELGSNATQFSRASGSIQSELAACQRYYYRISGATALMPFTNAAYYTTTQAYGVINFPVTMRTAPSASVSGSNPGTTALSVYANGSARTTSDITPQSSVVSTYGMEFRLTTASTTAGSAAFVRFPVNSTDFIEFLSEL